MPLLNIDADWQKIRRLGSVGNHSTTALITETNENQWEFWGPLMNPTNSDDRAITWEYRGWIPRHSRGANVAFLDGRVALVHALGKEVAAGQVRLNP